MGFFNSRKSMRWWYRLFFLCPEKACVGGKDDFFDLQEKCVGGADTFFELQKNCALEVWMIFLMSRKSVRWWYGWVF